MCPVRPIDWRDRGLPELVVVAAEGRWSMVPSGSVERQAHLPEVQDRVDGLFARISSGVRRPGSSPAPNAQFFSTPGCSLTLWWRPEKWRRWDWRRFQLYTPAGGCAVDPDVAILCPPADGDETPVDLS